MVNVAASALPVLRSFSAETISSDWENIVAKEASLWNPSATWFTPEVDEEISIGDYVLTNGCVAAIVVVDATVRFIPNVLGNKKGPYEETHEQYVFEGPCYTKPIVFRDKKVPEILLSGNHMKIEQFKNKKGLEKTKINRPDLYKKYKERIE